MRIENILDAKVCGDVFPNNREKAKKEYRRLSKLFHPDTNTDSKASEAFSIISALYTEAEKCFEANTWNESNILHIVSEKGKRYRYNYTFVNEFELGKMYTSKKNIFYVFNKGYEKYYNNYINTVNNLKYENKSMEEELSRYFPTILINFISNSGEGVIILNKTEDAIPLVQLIKIETIEAKHLAWILSRLNNIACYLDYRKLSHNGLSINNCFISPKHHTIMLYGGWWYCVDQGKKMIGTEKGIFNTMPIKARTKKIGSIETDLESIKYLSRKLSKDIVIPSDMLSWTNKGSADKAITEFEAWGKALDKAYGKRRFVHWKIDMNKFYKK